MADDNLQQEIPRIKAEYLARDTTGLNKQYSYQNPAFLYHMQEREWTILSMLRDAGIDLSELDVLEVGCGTGHILQRFLEFGVRKAVGIDLMEHRVKEGKNRYPNVLLTQGNAAQLPYHNGSFDCVMQFMCLSSVLDQTLREMIAAEMWRVLRPGGIILSYDMRPTPGAMRFCHKAFRLIKSFGQPRPDTGTEHPRATPTRPLNIPEIQILFRQGRFTYCTGSLNLKLARFAGASRFLATVLSGLTWFRTHYIALVRKPI